MKNTSPDLFNLIKSMGKPEKRYFKLYATRHFPANNQYTQLFSAIEKQSNYSERELMQQFSAKKSAAHFAVIKKQLYESILEALHRYDEFAQPEQKIRKGIHYCTLLLKKGLFDQCSRQIKKYKTLGYGLEKFENIIELIEIEKRLISKLQFTTFTYVQMQELQDEQDACIAKLAINGQYWLKSNRIFKMHYEKKIAPGRENEALTTLVNDEYFNDFSQATTVKSKLDFLQINALHAFVNGDVSNAYQLNTRFIQLLDADEPLKQLFADRYFSALNNYLIDSLLLKKYEALQKGIEALRILPEKAEFRNIHNLEANVFRLSYLLEMNYYVSTEKFSDALRCIKNIEDGLIAHSDKIAMPNVITFRYLIAYTFFCNKNFPACLDKLTEIISMRESESIPDLYRDSRMMQLLCHFELGNYLLLESLLVSFQRLLTAGKNQQQTVKVVTRFIKQSIQKLDKPKRSELEKELLILSENEGEKNLFNNFNYLYWVKEVTKVP